MAVYSGSMRDVTGRAVSQEVRADAEVIQVIVFHIVRDGASGPIEN